MGTKKGAGKAAYTNTNTNTNTNTSDRERERERERHIVRVSERKRKRECVATKMGMWITNKGRDNKLKKVYEQEKSKRTNG